MTHLTRTRSALGLLVATSMIVLSACGGGGDPDSGSAEELIAAIEKNGMSEAQAREQVATQVLVEQLVEDEDGSTTPSEKELRAIYAKAKKQAAGQEGQKIPPFAQVRDQIAEQAQSEQVGKVAQALLEDLRKDADITINL